MGQKEIKKKIREHEKKNNRTVNGTLGYFGTIWKGRRERWKEGGGGWQKTKEERKKQASQDFVGKEYNGRRQK